ncbi:MAG: urea carboxylase-associated family protein [Acidiferrobacterales bacterium]|nr:urea carboxylase-associated family protein [Acidiferrobacterales bacterium]
MADKSVIPARKGKAVVLNEGQSIRVIDTHGSQVVDTWIFNRNDLNEFQSNEHTRPTLLNLNFRPGDSLYTNKRRPIVKVEEDTSPGIHDMLMSACDAYRYQLLGCIEYHDNCTDNLASCMAEIGFNISETPCPINVFMNIPWTNDGDLSYLPPQTKPGDFVQFQALMDCVFAFSACPNDILATNGLDGRIKDAHFQVL